MKKVSAREHYDLLIKEGNDPLNDPPFVQNYMNKWDGQPFIDALNLSPENNVLEIGVGTGRLAKKVLETGCGRLTGIDLSPATIDKAKENLSGWNNISLVQGDFISYHFPQVFDIAYCSLTLFHFKDKRTFIKKVAGLLHAKGKFVLSIPKKRDISINMGNREVELYPDDLDVLRPLFYEAGFVMIKTIEVEFAHILAAEKND